MLSLNNEDILGKCLKLWVSFPVTKMRIRASTSEQPRENESEIMCLKFEAKPLIFLTHPYACSCWSCKTCLHSHFLGAAFPVLVHSILSRARQKSFLLPFLFKTILCMYISYFTVSFLWCSTLMSLLYSLISNRFIKACTVSKLSFYSK